MVASFVCANYLSEVTGIVISVDPASCVIQLNETGTQVGRLYKRDSKAFQTKQPFDQLPEYQLGKQITGLVNGKKQLNNQTLYYLKERWVECNPWESLTLQTGDEVSGRVSDAVPNFTAPVAYLIQLDNDTQPDIEVFLPVEEIPCLEKLPLRLKLDDKVKAIVTSIYERPPKHPQISISKLRPVYYQHQEKALTSSRAAFFVLRKDQIQHPVPLQNPLSGKHLVLIDDERSAIAQFKRAAHRFGAKTTTIEWHKQTDEIILTLLRKADEGSIDLVVIDDTLDYPTTGLTLLNSLKKSCPQWHFVLASGFFTPETIKQLQFPVNLDVAAIHKPVRLASLLQIFDGEVPREIILEGQIGFDIQELIEQAEIALQAAVGEQNSVDIMAFSIHDGDQLYGIGDSSKRLSPKVKTSWVNDPYFRVLFAGQTKRLALNWGEHSIANEILPAANGHPRPAKKFSLWYLCEVESQNLLIGHCFTLKPDLPPTLGNWMAEQLARRLWSWHWRENIAPTLAMGQQSAAIAHELTNFSNKATNQLEYLKRDYQSNCDKAVIEQRLDKLKDYLNKSRDTNAALLGSTASYGDWSFKSAGKEVFDMLLPLSQKCGIRLEISLPEVSLPCSKAALQLVLYNLINNAIKHHFSEDDVDNRLISVIALSDQEYIDITVQDNGPGIPRHVEKKLFQFGDSFKQYTNKSATEHSHGLGLWLARKLMLRYEGHIESETARGLGTAFTLRLPLTLGTQ